MFLGACVYKRLHDVIYVCAMFSCRSLKMRRVLLDHTSWPSLSLSSVALVSKEVISVKRDEKYNLSRKLLTSMEVKSARVFLLLIFIPLSLSHTHIHTHIHTHYELQPFFS